MQSSSEGWFTRPRLCLLLGMFLFLAFPAVFLGSESFFYRDMGLFSYPIAQVHREAFWRGEIPLWNSLSNCGIPFLAQWNTLVLYPGSLIYLLFPLPWSMSAFLFVHLFFAAAGMYALAREWTQDRFAASLAGLIFAWNGFTLHALMWPAIIAALAWMPWAVLALQRAWNHGGARRLALAALAASMQMLTGAAEIILLTWIFAGLFCLRDFLNAQKELSPKSRWRLFMRFGICGVAVALICSAQLLPFLELLRNSQRNASFNGDEWALPLWGWANFFVPLFRCTPSVVGVYSQDSQQWMSSYYMGASTIVFALLAFRARGSCAKWLTGVILVSIVLALGNAGGIYPVIKKVVPGLGLIRYPVKYIMLVVFALPLLASIGAATWIRDAAIDERPRRDLKRVTIGILLLIVFIVGWAVLQPLPDAPSAAVTVNGLWRGVLLLCVGAGLLFSLRKGWSGTVSRAAVLCLVAVDVLTHVPRQNPTVANGAYGELPSALAPVPKSGEARAMLSPTMQHLLEGLANPDLYTFYTADRRMLLYNCNLIDGVPKVNGFFPLYVRAESEVTQRLYRSTNYASLPLLDFLGVSQLSSVNELFRWDVRPGAMPLLSAGQQPRFAGRSETVDAIFSERFAPRSEVYLPAEAQASVAVASNACRIVSSRTSGQRITATVEAAAPSILVIAQTDYPAWRATLNGLPTPIWRANHAYQAIVVPAGTHQFELRYVDRFFSAGVWLSLGALAACFGVLLKSWRPVNRGMTGG